jgi:F0F1-type ATP synthase assembly protein I
MVVGMYWVQQITSISVEMVLPAGLGIWLDLRWGTGPWLLAVGAVFGFLMAFWHLLALAKRGGPKSSGPKQGGPKQGGPKQGGPKRGQGSS